MKNNRVEIPLPRAIVVRLSIPIIAIVIGVFLLIWGRANKLARLGGAVAIGIGLKGFWDRNSRKDKANNIYNKAIESIDRGRVREGLEEMKEGLEVDRTNPYLNFALIMINYQNKDYEEVLEYMDNIDMDRMKKRQNLTFDEDIAATIKGVALYETGRYGETLELLEPRQEKENFFKFLTAMSYRELGDKEKAVEVLETGLVVEDPEDRLAFDYWLGVNLFDLERREEAKVYFDQVYERDRKFNDLGQYMREYRD